jgi:hypothetical protein
LAVRGHKQTRKNIHGVYELQSETRKMTAIRGQGYRPLWRREGAVGPLPRNRRTKNGPGYTVSSRRQEAEGGVWVKRLELGSAHSSVALSLSMAAASSELW